MGEGDIFVGTLTRYYTAAWHTDATRASAARGDPQPLFVPREGTPLVNPVELERMILAWRDDFSSKVKDYLTSPLDWPEGMAPPHFVVHIGTGGRAGILLAAAHAQYPHLPRPLTLVANWRNDPAAMLCLANRTESPLFNIVNSGLWLPGSFKFGTQFPDPAGTLVQIGSVGLLKLALDAINAALFQAQPEEILAWRAIPSGTMDFDRQMKHGFATVYSMCRLAIEYSLPMKMHY